MKTILMSIQPQWVEKILNGEKTIEIRKTIPKCELPCKVYIYCTNAGRPLVFGQENACVEPHYTQTFGCSREYAEKTWGVLNGKVVAEFTLNKYDKYDYTDMSYPTPAYDGDPSCRECGYGYWVNSLDLKPMCLTYEQMEKYGNGKTLYGLHIDDLIIYDKPKEITQFNKPCISPEMPYCPYCPVGTESISESEQEAYRAFGECETEWVCLNWLKKPPQSWCYVEEV